MNVGCRPTYVFNINKHYTDHTCFLDQELISYRYSSCCCCSCSGDLFKKAIGSVVSNRIWMKFGTIVLQAIRSKYAPTDGFRISDMTSCIQDGGHDVISSRKVLPSDKCTRSVRPTPAATCCAYTSCRLAILSTEPDP